MMHSAPPSDWLGFGFDGSTTSSCSGPRSEREIVVFLKSLSRRVLESHEQHLLNPTRRLPVRVLANRL